MSEIKSIQIILDTDLWARVKARAALLKRTAAECAGEALEGWLRGSETRGPMPVPPGATRKSVSKETVESGGRLNELTYDPEEPM